MKKKPENRSSFKNRKNIRDFNVFKDVISDYLLTNKIQSFEKVFTNAARALKLNWCSADQQLQILISSKSINENKSKSPVASEFTLSKYTELL